MAKHDEKKAEVTPTPAPAAPAPAATAMVPVAHKESALVAADGMSPAMLTMAAALEKMSEKAQQGPIALMQAMNPNKQGLEESSRSGWRPSVIKIHQPVSTSYPAASKPGDIFSNDTGEVYKRPMRIVPLYMYNSNARFRTGEKTPSCRSEDTVRSIYGDLCAQCPDKPWNGGKMTDCNKAINWFAANEDFSELYMVQFSKSSQKAGALLFKQVSASKNVWDKIYVLDTQKGAGQNHYYVFSISASGDKTNEELSDFARGLSQRLGEIRTEIKARGAVDAEETRQAVEAMEQSPGEPPAKEDYSDL